MGVACVALLLAPVLVACGHGGDAPNAANGHEPGSAVPAASATPVDTAAEARDAWSVPEVLRRLREAGLNVTDSGQSVQRPELHTPGHQLHIGRGTLDVFIYPGRGARARDAAGLDTTIHGLQALDTPHYIISGNLIAILVTPTDVTVERVANALTARHTEGPP
ncbi:MAG: hypothetical protein ACREND_09500 [Gemmatimonadaceae bacterium]